MAVIEHFRANELKADGRTPVCFESQVPFGPCVARCPVGRLRGRCLHSGDTSTSVVEVEPVGIDGLRHPFFEGLEA